jgi:hypothetical protein
MKMDNNWPATRIIHLSGGSRAINEHNPIVHFIPNTIKDIQVKSYGAIYGTLESLGFRIIGVDFYTHIYEVEGTLPPNWRSHYRTSNTSWPTEETAQVWREIGNAGFKRKNGLLWDTSSRIGRQLRVCDRRLRDISESYSTQLQAKLKRDFQVGHRFEDGFTWITYLTLQSFLVDACILRDYLAEFAAEYIYKSMLGSLNHRITAMGMLIKKVLNKIHDPDPLTEELQIAVGENGWLKVLGNYRDLVIHAAPLARAKSNLMSLCENLEIGGGMTMPAIRCPLPENPDTIISARSKGVHFEDFENQFNVFVKAASGDVAMIDGMDYASETLGRLSELANKIAEKSPVAPEKMVFDESNIIGEIKFEKTR